MLNISRNYHITSHHWTWVTRSRTTPESERDMLQLLPFLLLPVFKFNFAQIRMKMQRVFLTLRNAYRIPGSPRQQPVPHSMYQEFSSTTKMPLFSECTTLALCLLFVRLHQNRTRAIYYSSKRYRKKKGHEYSSNSSEMSEIFLRVYGN